MLLGNAVGLVPTPVELGVSHLNIRRQVTLARCPLEPPTLDVLDVRALVLPGLDVAVTIEHRALVALASLGRSLLLLRRWLVALLWCLGLLVLELRLWGRRRRRWRRSGLWSWRRSRYSARGRTSGIGDEISRLDDLAVPIQGLGVAVESCDDRLGSRVGTKLYSRNCGLGGMRRISGVIRFSH